MSSEREVGEKVIKRAIRKGEECKKSRKDLDALKVTIADDEALRLRSVELTTRRDDLLQRFICCIGKNDKIIDHKKKQNEEDMYDAKG